MYRTVFWSPGDGEGDVIWENGTETCVISYVKQTTSPGSKHVTGCSGLVPGITSRDGMRMEVAGGFRMGHKCTPVAHSC